MSSEGGMWVGSKLHVPGQDLQDSSLHGLGKHTAYLVFQTKWTDVLIIR